MRAFELVATFLLALSIGALFPWATFGQETVKHDSYPGVIALGERIDSIIAVFGLPTRTDTLDREEGMRTYFYKMGIIIWADTVSNRVSSFEIASTAFTTSKGIRVGDSANKLEHVYGRPEREDRLNRLHFNYDYTFNDFCEADIYEHSTDDSAWYHVFYIKDARVVRILVYEGLGC